MVTSLLQIFLVPYFLFFIFAFTIRLLSTAFDNKDI